MTENLSLADKRVYAFVRNRLIHGEDAPTLAQINEVTGKSSPRSAVLALERLERAGLVRRSGRSIRLLSSGLTETASISTMSVPLVGSVAAGTPILAEENVEAQIRVSTALARPGGKYFLLRIEGQSMNQAEVGGAYINDGDIVLVRQQNDAEDGQIVVALVNDEATVKYFVKKQGMVILRPKSSRSEYTPIVLTDNCKIQGVVVAVLPSDLY